MGSYISSLALTVAGIMYPAYRSFKALERPGAEDDAMWLTYWIVFACFTLFETIADKFIFWIPFYYELKFAFVMYLQLPQTQGAKKLYDDHIKPYLEQQEGVIDEHLSRVTTNAKQTAIEYARTGVSKVVQKAPGVMTYVSDLLATENNKGQGDNVKTPLVEPVDDNVTQRSKKDR